MPTTQSKDPKEQVDHPRHYNQHPSGVECIEIIEHMPCNLGNAIKYIWRCGLKQSSAPLRDLRSAQWYVRRGLKRRQHFGADGRLRSRADLIWRVKAEQLIEDSKGREYRDLTALCLGDLLRDDLPGLLDRLKQEIPAA